ncbi:MAG: hypothetical protein JWN01_893 [Patescibacteria group bacterium]|jgi:hypothetical protein|nr:hypothetical protein [Patescibacteria group bacterium]
MRKLIVVLVKTVMWLVLPVAVGAVIFTSFDPSGLHQPTVDGHPVWVSVDGVHFDVQAFWGGKSFKPNRLNSGEIPCRILGAHSANEYHVVKLKLATAKAPASVTCKGTKFDESESGLFSYAQPCGDRYPKRYCHPLSLSDLLSKSKYTPMPHPAVWARFMFSGMLSV